MTRSTSTRSALIRAGLTAAALALAAPAWAGSYTILVYETAEDYAARSDAARAPAYWGSYGAFAKGLEEAGVLRGGGVLHGSAQARTVRVRGGATAVEARPVAVSAEQLGGYFVIEAPSLEVALQHAAKVPASRTGAVEVREAYPAPAMR